VRNYLSAAIAKAGVRTGPRPSGWPTSRDGFEAELGYLPIDPVRFPYCYELRANGCP